MKISDWFDEKVAENVEATQIELPADKIMRIIDTNSTMKEGAAKSGM